MLNRMTNIWKNKGFQVKGHLLWVDKYIGFWVLQDARFWNHNNVNIRKSVYRSKSVYFVGIGKNPLNIVRIVIRFHSDFMDILI